MTESWSEERFKTAVSSKVKDLGAEVTLTSYRLFLQNLPYLLMIFLGLPPNYSDFSSEHLLSLLSLYTHHFLYQLNILMWKQKGIFQKNVFPLNSNDISTATFSGSMSVFTKISLE